MTIDQLRRYAQRSFEDLAASETAMDEALTRSGLPPAFAWSSLTAEQCSRLIGATVAVALIHGLRS